MKITNKYGYVVVNEDKGYRTMSGILNNYSVFIENARMNKEGVK